MSEKVAFAEKEVRSTLSLEPGDIRKEMDLSPPDTAGAKADVDPELMEQAATVADRLFSIDIKDLKQSKEARIAAETMGHDLQKEAAYRSQLLKEPIHKLAARSEDGGVVAKALVDLNMQVEELDPVKFDLEPGWFTRLVGHIPGIGTPVKRYFKRFESADTVLAAIQKSLEDGKDQLKRDNITLLDDQQAMRELTRKLERAIQMGRLIDQKLETRIERELNDADRKKFLQEEVLFPLRQRIQDLQQQLAVNQQGVLSTEIIRRNNVELIRGVDRALSVTMSALNVAVTVALALADQKIVLDKVTSLNKTTENLIAGTAKQLRTQGAEIHKTASGSMLDMEKLKQAFADIHAAMDAISRYRQEALPKMAQAILEMDQLTERQEQTISQMEEGNLARSESAIEII